VNKVKRIKVRGSRKNEWNEEEKKDLNTNEERKRSLKGSREEERKRIRLWKKGTHISVSCFRCDCGRQIPREQLQGQHWYGICNAEGRPVKAIEEKNSCRMDWLWRI
jgi:hypothetical protein